jgi:DNA gyrase/topoisomerase IV, subunit A
MLECRQHVLLSLDTEHRVVEWVTEWHNESGGAQSALKDQLLARYMPILPMVLVNGAEGIGTGWSTSIPNYNPREIADNLIRMLDDEEPLEVKLVACTSICCMALGSINL